MSQRADSVRAWEERLGSRTILDDARDIANAVVDPRTANADSCWQVIWRVPLYANTFVSIGTGMVERLQPFMTDAWRTWGKPDGPIVVEHAGGRNSRDNFTVAGRLAAQVSATRVARHRLFAIQSAAHGFRAIVETHGESSPFAAFAKEPLDALVPDLIHRFGRGWGPVTALHLLTDFGLAVKPDLHLVRSVQSLGLAPNLRTDAVPNLKQALSINASVRELASDVFGVDFAPRDLRLLDVLLMEASRQRLISMPVKETL